MEGVILSRLQAGENAAFIPHVFFLCEQHQHLSGYIILNYLSSNQPNCVKLLKTKAHVNFFWGEPPWVSEVLGYPNMNGLSSDVIKHGNI